MNTVIHLQAIGQEADIGQNPKHYPRVYYVTMAHAFGDFVLKEKIAERLTKRQAIQAMNAINRAILALGLKWGVK